MICLDSLCVHYVIWVAMVNSRYSITYSNWCEFVAEGEEMMMVIDHSSSPSMCVQKLFINVQLNWLDVRGNELLCIYLLWDDEQGHSKIPLVLRERIFVANWDGNWMGSLSPRRAVGNLSRFLILINAMHSIRSEQQRVLVCRQWVDPPERCTGIIYEWVFLFLSSGDRVIEMKLELHIFTFRLLTM